VAVALPPARTIAGALQAAGDRIARAGGSPLSGARDGRLFGVIELKDIVGIGKQLPITRGA
jgi:high-affinity K+ transport system ATPase subunit B